MKSEQEELAKKQEDFTYRPWYEKVLDAGNIFAGKITDYKRATEVVDPVTGEKLTVHKNSFRGERGVTAEQIKEMRTLISETKFVNPTGKHGGKGSTKAHNELLQIIDTSKDYNMFKRRLQNWADYRFESGSDNIA
ncbi:hypothetical protein VSK91_21725 [Bacillus swezeyi]|uniref:hypothetical protein n=1 Tax=Bacillus swezeyi TaxID=1925020 RepID=UPI0039C5B43C